MPGRGIPEGPFATEQEIRAMAEVASEEDTIEEEEKELDPLHLRVRRHAGP